MSVAELASRYDGFIIDLWGVVHNGTQPYPGVLDCLARLRAARKRVAFLSNAPRRSSVVAKTLLTMGIAPSLYDDIVTSGEAVRDALKLRNDPGFRTLGERFYHLGPARDRDLFKGLPVSECPTPSEADFVLNTGPDDRASEDDPNVFDAILTECLAAKLPMICANPDLEVVRAGKRIICAGLLAERYAARGGLVLVRGKPDPAIYRSTLDLLGTNRRKTVAFGDSLRTDLAGAKAAAIDSVFVLSGIHDLSLEAAHRECREAGFDPIAIMPRFVW